MFSIKTFAFNLLQENTYVVSDDTLECVIIDCGAYYDDERKAITEYIDSRGRASRLWFRFLQAGQQNFRSFRP